MNDLDSTIATALRNSTTKAREAHKKCPRACVDASQYSTRVRLHGEPDSYYIICGKCLRGRLLRAYQISSGVLGLS